MIARAKPSPRPRRVPAWHGTFLTLLPTIRRYARHAFRHLPPEAREEAVADVTANALVAYVRLVERNKVELAFPTALTKYGVFQHRCGRRVGAKLNINDITSPYCRAMKGVEVKRLDHYDEEEEAWKEILVPDKRATPAELAASRIDFPAWLDTLTRRDRKLAMKLATGESTGRVARMFRISAGRVSQLRRELRESWQKFVGEPGTSAA